MSAELRNFRGKVTIETDCALEAENRVTGEDKSVIARNILHEWAIEKIRIAKVMDSLLRSEGEPGIASGAEGNLREVGRK